jgi:hypothetical protein
MTNVTADDAASTATASGSRLRRRALAVVAAAVAPLVVFLVAGPVLGVHLQTPDRNPGEFQDLGPATVIVTGLVAGLLGWALLAVLERVTGRARGIWTGIAVAVFLVSLFPPLASPGLAASQRVSLACLHIAVAAVLIPLLRGSARSSSGR